MAKTTKEVLDVLDAWRVIDFLDQRTLDKPHKREKGKVIAYLFKPRLDGCNDTLVVDTCSEHAKQYANRYPVQSSIALYIGSIPRVRVTNKLAKLADDSYEPIESQDHSDSIALMLLMLGSDGRLGGIELSPLIWTLGQAASKGYFGTECFSLTEYEDQLGKIQDGINKLKEGPLSWGDIDIICRRYLSPLLSSFEMSEEEKEKCLAYRLVDFKLVDSTYAESRPESLDNEAHLSFRFFTRDIEDTSKAINEAIKKQERMSPDQLHHSSLGLALSYIEGGSNNKERFDMRSDSKGGKASLSSFYRELLSSSNLPLGKWPSKYPLSLMQQAAVNMTVGREWGKEGFPANDIVSVNGPPGTGKTTLVKDVIAANVVQKARLLAEYETPDDAFEKVSFKYASKQNNDRTHYIDFAPEIYKLENDDINNLGIIICSSNNDAVENISKELPRYESLVKDVAPSDEDGTQKQLLGQVHSAFSGGLNSDKLDWGYGGKWTDVYFSRAAKAQFAEDERNLTDDERPWALIAARLGKGSNISKFAWQLNKIYWLIPGEKNQEAYQKRREIYEKTRRQFNELYDKVEQELHERDDYNRKQSELKTVECTLSDAQKKRDLAEQQAGALKNQIDEIEENARSLTRQAQFDEGKDVGDSAVSWERLNAYWEEQEEKLARLEAELSASDSRVKAANDRLEEIKQKLFHIGRKKAENELREAKKEQDSLRPKRGKASSLKEKLKKWQGYSNSRSDAYAERRKKLRQQAEEEARAQCLDKEKKEIETELGSIRTVDDNGRYLFPTDGLIDPLVSDQKAAHLSNPTSDFEIDRKREMLFYWALQLTRDFILASSCMKKNMLNLYAMWGGTVKPTGSTSNKERIKYDSQDRRLAMPILLQTLMIVTPVISTTFASAGRLFKDVQINASDASEGKAPFGLVIVDEAGQAAPLAALGTFARARRALVVGDPLQIEPIVNEGLNVFRKDWNDRLGREYTGTEASVQGLADMCNPYGSYLSNLWLGCPLVVHRRCISPMFDISNEVSYAGTMLNETQEPSKNKRFCLPSSQWIQVSGKEEGSGNHYVEKQGERALQIIRKAFELRGDGQALPSLYVISPFVTVVNGLKNEMRLSSHEGINKGDWDNFIDTNIGTVHTFQGKEADEVVFLLGCDETSSGAVGWVKPNIVNVAASRAKYRLYVIGDASVWANGRKKNDYVSTMKEILDTQWIPHYKAWNERHDEKELERARQLLHPLGESVIEVLSADNDGNDDELLNTDSYMEAVTNRLSLSDMGVDDALCAVFGFDSKSDFESTFADCSGPRTFFQT